ncbi:MAG: lytic murein transglycosylase B [Legionellaceae bacterium]|nr:lytic murein transglycosylase B [Legionellaceae bacterium]
MCTISFGWASTFSDTPEVSKFITMMVKKHGFQRAQLTQIMNQVSIQQELIDKMDHPYEKKSWDAYQSLFITPDRIRGGLAFWKSHKNLLEKAEKEYGVPPQIIVAILGVETRYGERQGDYRVMDALSTLAFAYPKRADYFKRELEEYLLLCQEHHESPLKYKGSMAGAIGMPQFMPSSYRKYAVSFSGKADLTRDDAAVIASVANYFQKHGWIPQESVAQPARIQGSAYHRLNANAKVPLYALKQLEKAGVYPMTASEHTPAQVGLIALETTQGSEYWLAYPNFYVITRYNNSPQYALAVYLLAQQLKMQLAVEGSRKQGFAYS